MAGRPKGQKSELIGAMLRWAANQNEGLEAWDMATVFCQSVAAADNATLFTGNYVISFQYLVENGVDRIRRGEKAVERLVKEGWFVPAQGKSKTGFVPNIPHTYPTPSPPCPIPSLIPSLIPSPRDLETKGDPRGTLGGTKGDPREGLGPNIVSGDDQGIEEKRATIQKLIDNAKLPPNRMNDFDLAVKYGRWQEFQP